ncbi:MULTISPECIES: 23S rRNA pseudouridine(2605) synthase RluB [unclassified Methylococcus]|uniref:23S rRNA pseudouridine(2605) synthase RluB n=1 Tax=unclassified Methylococcus TaxID=2618889 RepID=UPI003D7D6C35
MSLPPRKPTRPIRPRNRPIQPTPGPEPAEAGEGERIQKALARAGFGSRREIEALIRDGKVFLNRRPAHLGDRYRKGDQIMLNGHLVNLEKRLQAFTRVLLYHKPVGELVSRRDPEGRPVIFSRLPRLELGRWVAVGRLDVNTQGLILLTNNGELAHRLMHPSRAVEREYAVRILGTVSEAVIERLLDGVQLEDGPARFESVAEAGGEGANRWFHVVVREGRNRLVRRLWESQNLVVSRLIRVRYGDIVLPPRLRAGASIELEGEALDGLLRSVGLPPVTPETPQKRRFGGETRGREERRRNRRSALSGKR